MVFYWIFSRLDRILRDELEDDITWFIRKTIFSILYGFCFVFLSWNEFIRNFNLFLTIFVKKLKRSLAAIFEMMIDG